MGANPCVEVVWLGKCRSDPDPAPCQAVSAGSAALTDVPVPAWAGDSAVTRIETFNLHLKQMWLPRGGGGSSLSW